MTHDHIFLWVSLLADTSWSGMKEAKFGADTVTAFSNHILTNLLVTLQRSDVGYFDGITGDLHRPSAKNLKY